MHIPISESKLAQWHWDPGVLSRVPPRTRGRKVRGKGFTLLELIIALAIIGIMAAIAIPYYRDYTVRVRVARAVYELRVIDREIAMYRNESEPPRYPLSLAEIGRANYRDPWGNPYEYLNIADSEKKGGGGDKARKDRFMVPVNSDFDLYSKGKDGDSKPPFTAKMSRDDVVRAADGAFYGLAEDF